MDTWLQAFKEIAPYLTHPLVLVGFVLLLFFGFHRTILKAGIIPSLTVHTGGRVVQVLLRYGFAIALVVIVMGFGLLFYRETQPSVDVETIVEQLETKHHQEVEQLTSRHQVEFADWKRQATEAVTALANLQEEQDALPGIDNALESLEKGDAKPAAEIFRRLAEREDASPRQRADAYRYRSVLILPYDPREANQAYRKAVAIDTDGIANNPMPSRAGDHSQKRAGTKATEEKKYVSIETVTVPALENVKGQVKVRKKIGTEQMLMTAALPLPTYGEITAFLDYKRNHVETFKGLLTATGLKANHRYVLTIKIRENNRYYSDNKQLEEICEVWEPTGDVFCDFDIVATDSTGALLVGIDEELPKGRYKVMLLIKDMINWTVVWSDDLVEFTVE